MVPKSDDDNNPQHAGPITVAGIRSLWDYNDPAATEQAFLALLPDARTRSSKSIEALTTYAVLLTQIARTHSLRRQFDQAHALLDAVEPLLDETLPEARVYWLLERGRTLNSSGDGDSSLPLFEQAWDAARKAQLDGLAVDAAHMIAIVGSGDDALRWSEIALHLAESSDDPDARRWLGSLHNNIGWAYHQQSSYTQALRHFERALAAREAQGDAGDIRIARWCIARCLRSLGRVDEALAMQQSIADDARVSGVEPDGYVHEELAECLHALGRAEEARPHFQRAHELLSQDAWLVEQEPERIARLRRLASD